MRRGTIQGAVAAWCIAAAGLAQAQAQLYRFEFLTVPGGTSLIAQGVNARGQVVGAAYDADGVQQAVVWQAGTPTVLPGLGGTAAATAVNGRGQVAGYAWAVASSMQAVRWDDAGPTVLGHPSHAGGAYAVAINLRGQVAGNLGELRGGPSQAVRWDLPRRPTLLDALGGTDSRARGMNAAGDVVGYIVGPNGSGLQEPVVWRGSTATLLGTLLPTVCCNQAAAINDLGQIVGWSSTGGPVRAVVWNGLEPTALRQLSDADNALALNHQQQAVGVLNAGGVTRAALWNLATGAGIDLNVHLPPRYQREHWTLASALAINDRGVIVGVAFNDSSFESVPYQLVPLPAP